MSGADDEFLWEFLVESYENLDTIDSRLIALESASDPDAIAAIFRAMHTIKGTSGFFGFGIVERLAHVSENLLGKIRDGELTLTEARASALLAATDGLRHLFAGIEASGTEPETDIVEMVARLEALTTGEVAPAAAAAPVVVEAEPDVAEPDVAEPAAIEVVEVVEVVAAAAAPATRKPRKKAAAAAAATPEPVAEEPPAVEAPAAPTDGIPPTGDRRSKTRRAEDVVAQAEQLLVKAVAERQAPAPAPARAADDHDVNEPRHGTAEDSTIRLDVSVLDELMNLVGELVLARNSLVRSISQVEDRSLLADAQRIDLVTSELQARVLRTRMRPIRTVWSKLPRLVREVSVACGRSVNLELEGEDTELDKSVVEAIKDPMTHCVRNAVDHGIESPEDRIAAGKPATGRLHLKASHENGQVVIQVSDDGRGIDPDKLRAKAIEKGLLTEEAAYRLSDREMLDMIFAPGFSTAEKVTEVSGRGVGMDVVRTNVERIGGSVSVTSVLGEGTTFTFAIPLTLAIIPALLVGIGDHRYAIPQSSLVELVRLTGDDAVEQIENMHGLAVHRLRGRLLPIIDGAALFNVPKPPPKPGKKRLTIAVLQADGGAFGLVVDDVHGTEEIVVKPIGAHYSGIGTFAGATILGDGVVSLIVDVAGVASRAGVANQGEEITSGNASGEIVDDLPQYVIVSVPGNERYAIPLERVARLEKFDRKTVEHVAGSYVVQYRDGLLPLTLLGGYGLDDRATVTTAVLSSDQGEVGVVVERVVDVASGANAGGSITVADERATEVVDVDRLVDSCRHLMMESV